jgi:hypothetical protein
MNTHIESLKEQLLYLVDELTAQRPLFSRVSDAILSERPPEGKSIRDHYENMLAAERDEHALVIRGVVDKSAAGGGKSVDAGNIPESTASAEPASIDEILQQISEFRSKNVTMLPPDNSILWSAPVKTDGETPSLLEWTYQMALNDAETLRAITTQLSEIRMLFRK